MRFWVGVISAAGAGLLTGVGLGVLLVEDKLKKEYEESAASMRRAFEAARIDAMTTLVESPSESEDDLIHLSEPLGSGSVQIQHVSENFDSAPDAMGTALRLVNGDNPYHRAIAETSPQIYASYAELEEEDYYDEDGRVKEQITMVFDDGIARFFNNGEEIDDAFDRVGGSIVDTVRAAVREGNPVVWVRNNKTEVDYEVIFEQS